MSIPTNQIIQGDCLEVMRDWPDECIDMCVTSPPYWGLRDYGVEGQLGLEKTPEEYVDKMVAIFREVRRVLKKQGTLWLNLGDSYAGGGNYRGLNSENTLSEKQSSNRGARGICQELGAVGKETGCKSKDLVGIPWLVAFALRADGWYLRQDIIWAKPNPMPESVTDRCTKAHEYMFLLSKSKKYYYDQKAISEPCVESNDARPRMGQGKNTQYEQKRKSMKMPDGWDTGQGSHGSYHRKGREKGRRNRAVFRGGNDYCNNNSFKNSEKKKPLDTGLQGEIAETRNKRSVWTIPTRAYPDAHFATFPEALVEPCILAGCPKEVCSKCGKASCSCKMLKLKPDVPEPVLDKMRSLRII